MSTSRGTKHGRTHSSARHESATKRAQTQTSTPKTLEQAIELRIQTQTSTPDTLEQAIEQIKALNSQLNDVLNFVEDAGISARAPTAVRTVLLSRENGLDALVESMDQEMEQIYDSLCQKTLESEKTGVTSDDFSKAMLPWIRQIEGISRIHHPQALCHAYSLLRTAMATSHGDLDWDRNSGTGDRPSDEPADKLMVRLIGARLSAGETWHWELDFVYFELAAELMACRHGVEKWLPETRKALKECVKAAEKAARVSDANRKVKKRTRRRLFVPDGTPSLRR